MNIYHNALAEARRSAAKSVVLKAVEEARSSLEEGAMLRTPAATPLDYTVYENLALKTTKVHFTICKHLRSGPEEQDAKTTGKRFYCATQTEAEELAERLRPGFSSLCKMCIGQRHWLNYYDPGRLIVAKRKSD